MEIVKIYIFRVPAENLKNQKNLENQENSSYFRVIWENIENLMEILLGITFLGKLITDSR